jgi:hypothetical protein
MSLLQKDLYQGGFGYFTLAESLLLQETVSQWQNRERQTASKALELRLFKCYG